MALAFSVSLGSLPQSEVKLSCYHHLVSCDSKCSEKVGLDDFLQSKNLEILWKDRVCSKNWSFGSFFLWGPFSRDPRIPFTHPQLKSVWQKLEWFLLNVIGPSRSAACCDVVPIWLAYLLLIPNCDATIVCRTNPILFCQISPHVFFLNIPMLFAQVLILAGKLLFSHSHTVTVNSPLFFWGIKLPIPVFFNQSNLHLLSW